MTSIRHLSVLLMCIIIFSIVKPVHAGNATVTNCGSFMGAGSISDAVTTANTGGGTITFNCSGTITFSSSLAIYDDVIINANGNIVIFDGNNTTNLFGLASNSSLQLNNFTLQNGLSAGVAGAIYVISTSTLTVNNSSFINNDATISSGAIEVLGTAIINNSTFTNNSSPNGGAIRGNFGATLTITNSTFTNNNSDYGGAISNDSTLSITNSSFIGNDATITGGAIQNDLGSVTISTTTFTGNNSDVVGGAIHNSGTITITNSTINNNTAFSLGDGVNNSGGVVNSQNTHYENNDCSGTAIVDNGGNTSVTAPGCPNSPIVSPPTPPPATTISTATILGCALDTADGVEVANAPDNTYCRVLMKNGGVVSYPGAVPTNLVGLGVILAVDVYQLQGGSTVNTFPSYAQICLAGNGRLFYMDGRNAPRFAIELASETVNGLTCGWIPAPGTLILTH